MALEHARFPTPQHPCSYLPGRLAVQDVRLLTDVSPEETEHLVERGWRRFGPEYFRPVCVGCEECVSLRVPVQEFAASRSQRRVVRKCADVEVTVSAPTVNEERLVLYQKWHESREEACGWNENRLTGEEYAQQFCFPHVCGREMCYRLGGRLMGVGLVDLMPRSISSIYFYYDPDFASLSPGMFSALCEILFARQMGKEFVYFGYRVAGCRSVAYKSAYRPHELLTGRPGDEEKPVWKKMKNEGEVSTGRE